MSETKYFPTTEAIDRAADVLSEILTPTPFQRNNNLSDIYEADVYLKREDLQMVRSYKIRGAYNKIRSLSQDALRNGIVCASAGNHAQGVAFSCNKLKIVGSIFMPVTTPKQKIEQVRMFGREFIEIVLTGDTFDAANSAAIQYAKENDKTFIPPFDDPKVMEGQGTIGREILSQTEEKLDYVFVPIGGGGLASGLGSYFKSMSPDTKIIGVEPGGAPCMKTAIEKGEIVELDEIDQFVDALLSGGAMPVSSMEGASTVAVCAASVESAKLGKPIQIQYPQV